MLNIEVDFYLGGDLGEWVLKTATLNFVRQVFTLDENIVRIAQKCGLTVHLRNPNSISFDPSTIGFSIHYPRILKNKLIQKYIRIYNLHPGYLPWGRGYFPIFWALWEGTPAGATLHEITEKVDQGPIVEQIEVEYFPEDSGGSLFQRVRHAEKKLFLEYWPKICRGEVLPSFPQPPSYGTYYSKQMFFELKQRANWEYMNGKDLVRLIRCLTFPGYSGLEVTFGKQRFQLHLEPQPNYKF